MKKCLIALAALVMAPAPAAAQHWGGHGHFGGGRYYGGHYGWGGGRYHYGYGYGWPVAGFGLGVALGAGLGSAWSAPYYPAYPAYPGYPAYPAYPYYAYPPPAPQGGPYACGSWIWHPESNTYAWAPCAPGGPNVVVPPADQVPPPGPY